MVDNGSNDRTIEEIMEYPRVRLLRNKANYGLGYAMSQAYSMAKNDLLLVSNPDIIFSGLPELLRHSNDHPESELMWPALEHSGEGAYSKVVFWTKFPHFLNFSTGALVDRVFSHFLTKYCLAGKGRNEHSLPMGRRYLYGASCMMFRRELVERIGGIYKPEYRYAWADADMGMRLAQVNAISTTVPEAVMKHYGSYSTKRQNARVTLFVAANGQKHFEKSWGHSSLYFTALLADTIFIVSVRILTGRGGIMNKIVFLKGWLS